MNACASWGGGSLGSMGRRSAATPAVLERTARPGVWTARAPFPWGTANPTLRVGSQADGSPQVGTTDPENPAP